jgi:hypothetical protein
MGKPGGSHVPSSRAEYIGVWRQTQGTDTSQYLKEEKSIEIPLVAASEGGIAQTEEKQFPSGLWDLNVRLGRLVEPSGKSGHRG